MKFTMALAVILTFGVPLCGQQDKQKPYPHEIPSPNGGIYVGPIPNPFDVPIYAGPIPNWHGSYGQWVPRGIEMPPCVIVKKNGKRYRYVKSNLPREVQPKKRLTDQDLQKLRDKGAGVQILEPRYTKDDLEKAWQACEKKSRDLAH